MKSNIDVNPNFGFSARTERIARIHTKDDIANKNAQLRLATKEKELDMIRIPPVRGVYNKQIISMHYGLLCECVCRKLHMQQKYQLEPKNTVTK